MGKQKIIAYLLLLTMAFTAVFGGSVFADGDIIDESGATQYEDENQGNTPGGSTANYDTAVGMLKTLGIVDEAFSSYGTMTRGEFAKFVLQVLNIDIGTGGIESSTSFDDVPGGYTYESEILAVYDLGIMNGVGNNLFEPDTEITYEQAVKVVVCMLGYGLQAQNEANDLIHYVDVANQYKLLRGITANLSEAITGGVAAQMIYNALDVKILTKTQVGLQDKYTNHDGDTILARHEIVKNKDIVTATSITSLTGVSTLRKDQVAIGDITYYKGNVSADEYLGYYVNAYAKEEKDSTDYATLLYLEPVENRNETIEIQDSQWVGAVVNSDKSITIRYRDEVMERKITVNKFADIISQGVANPLFDFSNYTPKNGTVTLLDNDGDGEYEVLFVREYNIITVENISKSSYKLSGDQGSVELNPDNSNYHFRIVKNGVEIAFEDIKTLDILSVMEGKALDGRSYREVIVCDTKVVGTIEEITEFDGYIFLTINSKQYQAMPTKDTYSLGTTGTFMLDFRGNIVDYRATANEINMYGYVISAKNDKGIAGTVTFKILNQEGDIEELTTRTTVTFDGKRSPAADILNQVDAATGESKTIGQLIMYKTDSNNEITWILTKYNPAQDRNQGIKRYTSPLTEAKGDIVLRRYNKNVPIFYYPNAEGQTDSTFIGKEDTIMLDSNALVFVVPEDGSIIEDEKFSVRGLTYFTHENDYLTEVFNVDESGFNTTSLIVVRYGSKTQTINKSARPYIVDEISKRMNEDDEVVYVINCLGEGKVTELPCSKDLFEESYTGKKPTDLKKGDIIRFSKNQDGEIVNLSVLLEFGSPYQTDNANYRAEPLYTYGEVLKVQDTIVKLQTKVGDLAPVRHFNLNTLPVNIYDVSAGKDGAFEVGTVADIEPGDKIYVRSSDGWVTDIILIKE